LVLWSSGTSVLECLINMDKAVQSGKWRPDKKAIAAAAKSTPKVK